MIGLFLMGSLVALLVYAGATVHRDINPGPVAAEAGRSSGPISPEQVMLSSALILGPVTALLLLEN